MTKAVFEDDFADLEHSAVLGLLFYLSFVVIESLTTLI